MNDIWSVATGKKMFLELAKDCTKNTHYSIKIGLAPGFYQTL